MKNNMRNEIYDRFAQNVPTYVFPRDTSLFGGRMHHGYYAQVPTLGGANRREHKSNESTNIRRILLVYR